MVEQHAFKLTLVVILGLFALGLGTIVLTLQMMVFNMKRIQRQQMKTKVKHAITADVSVAKPGTATATIITSSNAHETIARSSPTYRGDLWLWKERDLEKGRPLSAQAYWDQVVQSDLSRWDATLEQQDLSYPDAATQAHVLHSLKEAADLGHADAQHYYAFALSTGVWPVSTTGLSANETSLFVPDDLLDYPADKEQSSREAWLNWHMSAVDGNVEAAAALGYRLLQREGHNKDGCEAALPYYEAAAHGIVDQLEAHIHSRAKVVPPQDLHSLPEMHMHGGTSSQLSSNSKPHESPEAVQYLRMRAMHPTDADVHAAHNLAQLHHYGLRGVEMNLTEALQYYEIAAEKNLWEASGQAGKFHVWSLGMDNPKDRKLLKAHRLFKKGTPGGLAGCKARLKDARKRQMHQANNVITISGSSHICDHPSVNGMGLLYLMGVPMVVPRDVSIAQQWFQLGMEMGNMDAAYNLGMVKLGWKTSWKDIDEESIATQKNGISVEDGTIPSFMMEGSMSFKYRHVQHSSQPSASDYLTALSDFTTAANKGHLQAHHMLGLLYSNGITHPTQVKSKPFVKRDCSKALQHYSWIVEEASLPLSKRTTTAYNQYMAGDNEGALRNYWMAAETGHAISQVNAAFLLDRGTCLGMTPEKCRRASLRLWKAAAAQGHVEAALKVGDYFYYKSPYTTPPSWWKWILFPEREIVALWKRIMGSGESDVALEKADTAWGGDEEETGASTCGAEDDTCSIEDDPTRKRRVADEDLQLSKAAQYYRMASVQHKSPRAHFNLGFLYEWGLGLKQDFPLAKRHYDLARSSVADETSSDEATDAAVSMALWCMKLHEQAVKLSVSYSEWRSSRQVASDSPNDTTEAAREEEEYDPEDVTEIDVILKHVLSWESLLIVILTYLLSIIFSYRATQRRR